MEYMKGLIGEEDWICKDGWAVMAGKGLPCFANRKI